MATYGFDHAWEGEWGRMLLAETLLDSLTVRRLEVLGVGEGWRCLEVGAGAGSIARWLCRRVGASGRVVATDIDTRFIETLGGLGEPGLEVRRHDIVADDPLEPAFDLAHARLVLQHLGAREQAVKRIAGTLVPGGLLLVEELDFASSGAASPFGARAFGRVERAIHRFLSGAGFEPNCGRGLPGLLRAAGLADVEARGGLSVVPGGSLYAAWYRQSIEALRPRIVGAGFVTEREVERAVALLDDPGFELMTPVLISAWGRRPT